MIRFQSDKFRPCLKHGLSSEGKSWWEVLFPSLKLGNNTFDLSRFAVAAVNSGNRRTWHILLPTFQFGSNISKELLDMLSCRSALGQSFKQISLRETPLIFVSNTSSFVLTRPGITAKWSAATGKTRNAFILSTLSSLWLTFTNSLLSITTASTTYRCVPSPGFLLSNSLSNLFDNPTQGDCEFSTVPLLFLCSVIY